MKTALVTGGAGFIGTNLCIRLLKDGYKVIAVDNLITSSGENTKSLKNNPNFTFIKHDIIKPFPSKILNTKYQILNTIFHLACPTGVPNVTKLGEEMLLTCSVGTKNVLELAREHKSKLLFTSSSEVYGDPEKFPQTEMYTGNVDQIGIRSTYEEGKRFSESLVALYVRKYKLDAKIVRIFNTYGPFMSFSDTRVIPNFIQKITKNKSLPVQGKGLQRRTFCYVDDLVNGFLTVIEKGNSGEAYNLGGDKEYAIRELAQIMIALSNNPKLKIDYIPRPGHDHQARRPDLKKVKKLGWRQTIELEEGLKKSFDWYNLHK